MNSQSESAIGIMDGAFFVSKGELIDWVNTSLDISITKVEQCASGAIYCQIIDALFPGRVHMKRVNWNAKFDYEYLPNYKILQRAFDDCNISKHIEVDRLVRAKFQDNLEFLQWLKCFSENKCKRVVTGYEASKRRTGALPDWCRSICQERGQITKATSLTLKEQKVKEKKDRDFQLLIESERDFYFEKLREIEVLTEVTRDSDNPQVAALVSQIQQILFAEFP